MRPYLLGAFTHFRKLYRIGIFVLFIMPPLSVASALGNTASPSYAITDPSAFVTIIGSLSVFANRVAEGFKRGLKLKFPTISEDAVAFISLVSSFLAALASGFPGGWDEAYRSACRRRFQAED